MTPEIPGYTAGTWTLDTVHSEVGFTVRHMMISKVKGFFENFSGTIVTAENPLDSTVVATIEADSINTKNKQRDAHIQSGDFLLAEEYPQLTFNSTGVRYEKGEFFIDGDMTIRGVTKPVTLDFDLGGFSNDPSTGPRFGGTATTTINRQEFGVSFNSALETGGVMLGDDIKITLEIAAAKVE
ncbi:YceI family protein [Actinomyces minihominis]|uniref:YceI family protein n=1 Tax=Actinomyces minihominis TaxID=2002838 RepID=UPI000C073A96|nr:YceI family protein [Actinomyces minihominis]